MAIQFFCFRFVLAGVLGSLFFAAAAISQAGQNGGTDFLNDDFYQDKAGDTGVNDPLEPLNRAVFEVNDKLYLWVMEPVATVYSHAIPQDLRGCIDNFFWNLAEPVRFLNSLLQGRTSDAGHVLFRFAVNSTLGIYGLGDPAAREFSTPQVEASLGGTLANWGVGDGFYLVVPLYGSSTLRDLTGEVVDSFGMTPYYGWTDDFTARIGVYTGKQTNALSLHLGEYEKLKNVLFDPYISFRNGYLQHRREQQEFRTSILPED